MISSKAELALYLKQDKYALGYTKKRPFLWGDEIWKFEIRLRKCEYYKNLKRKNILQKIARYYYAYMLMKDRIRYGFSIPLNVFGPGLSIAHIGSMVVNDKARIGQNCRIQESVTIGATNGSAKAPTIGNNVFIGSGARIIGDISVGDNVAIGANAVVVKDVESGITVGGVPAKKISSNDSSSNLRYHKISKL